MCVMKSKKFPLILFLIYRKYLVIDLIDAAVAILCDPSTAIPVCGYCIYVIHEVSVKHMRSIVSKMPRGRVDCVKKAHFEKFEVFYNSAGLLWLPYITPKYFYQLRVGRINSVNMFVFILCKIIYLIVWNSLHNFATVT